MSLVLRLVVGGVEVVDAACQAGIHYGKVLIWQCEVYAQLRLETVEESLELLSEAEKTPGTSPGRRPVSYRAKKSDFDEALRQLDYPGLSMTEVQKGRQTGP